MIRHPLKAVATLAIGSLLVLSTIVHLPLKELEAFIATESFAMVVNNTSAFVLSPLEPDPPQPPSNPSRCAICFYGLPRAFKPLVLPSLIQNVVIPNEEYRCDYFAQYHKLEHEDAGRSGAGGTLNVEDIYLLRDEVEKRGSRIEYVHTTDAVFMEKYRALLDKINNTNDPKGKPLYFPWKSKTYSKPTTTNNIIKMWHSIEQAWNLTAQAGTMENYERIAMMRSDVFYMSPIDAFEYPDKAVIPGFARYPVSDRMVIGPPASVQIWASERFARMEDHVQDVYKNRSRTGYGLHSEKFVDWALFPPMREVMKDEHAIVEHPSVCFFRVRADESIWMSDCSRNTLPTIDYLITSNRPNTRNATIAAIESILGRICYGPPVALPRGVQSLNCTLPSSDPPRESVPLESS